MSSASFPVSGKRPWEQKLEKEPHPSIPRRIRNQKKMSQHCNVALVVLKSFHFVSSELRGLRDPQQVECYQDQAQIMLGDYIRRHFPGQQVRFGKLLLMLPSLRMVNPKTIEELFFRQTIGSVAIESLLCDMFKSSQLRA